MLRPFLSVCGVFVVFALFLNGLAHPESALATWGACVAVAAVPAAFAVALYHQR
jgi:hypothetical protein